MALIQIKSEWDETNNRSVPVEYSIVGDGPILISRSLLDDANPSLMYMEGDGIIVIGPYRLRVIGVRYFDVYECEMIQRPNNPEE